MEQASKDIRYGDVVDYVFMTGLFDGLDRLTARVYAKINSSTLPQRMFASSIFIDVPWYAVKPMPAFEEKMAQDPVIDFVASDDDRFEIEWGKLPSRPFIVVDELSLDHTFGDMMKGVLKKEGLCPRCGDEGAWKSLALVCPFHGIFL